MMSISPAGDIRSSVLSAIPDLIHGFSTRVFGDMKHSIEKRDLFMNQLDLTTHCLFWAEQVHGNNVAILSVKNNNTGRMISQADAIVLPFIQITTKCALGTFYADCVPMLFVDKRTRTIAVAHAGWKGTLHGIAGKTVSAMLKLGSQLRDIYVVIGPHIGLCCYAVSKDRYSLFRKKSGFDSTMVAFVDGQYYVDIGRYNYAQLLSQGILSKNIDYIIGCTHCQRSLYYSYRGDTNTRPIQEMMGCIAWM